VSAEFGNEGENRLVRGSKVGDSDEQRTYIRNLGLRIEPASE
jgi:hypothetical protein